MLIKIQYALWGISMATVFVSWYLQIHASSWHQYIIWLFPVLILSYLIHIIISIKAGQKKTLWKSILMICVLVPFWYLMTN